MRFSRKTSFEPFLLRFHAISLRRIGMLSAEMTMKGTAVMKTAYTESSTKLSRP